MSDPKDQLPKVRPFVEIKTQPRRNTVDVRGLLSIALLLVSMGSLTIAGIGAGKLVWDVFGEGLGASLSKNHNGMFEELVVIGLAYAFGWGVALVTIRVFGNLIYQIIIQTYAVACLIAVSFLYLKIIPKLYMQGYNDLQFWAYLFMLLGGLTALISLHLLIEGHDLRPFSIPILFISVVQLFMIIYRYIFAGAKSGYLLSNLTIFVVMVSISALMLAHLGMLSSIRNFIDDLFKPKGKGDDSGNDDDDDSERDAHWVGKE